MVANASTDKITRAAVRQLSYMPTALLKIVYIKPPGICAKRYPRAPKTKPFMARAAAKAVSLEERVFMCVS